MIFDNEGQREHILVAFFNAKYLRSLSDISHIDITLGKNLCKSVSHLCNPCSIPLSGLYAESNQINPNPLLV